MRRVAAVLLLVGGCAGAPGSSINPRALLYQLRAIDQEVQPGPGGLTPEAAVALALVYNPELRTKRLERKIAAGRVISAGAPQNPELRLSLRSALEGSPLLLADALRFYPVIPAEEEAAVAEARAEEDRVKEEIAALEAEVAARALLEHAELVALHKKVQLYQGSAALHQRIVSLEEARLAEHLATRLDLTLTRLRLDDLDERSTLAAVERERAEAKLARVLGLPSLPGEIAERSTQSSTASQARLHLDADALEELALDARADLRALRRGWESREARVRLRLAKAAPRLSFVEPGVAKIGGKPRLDLDAAIALPIFDDGKVAVEKAAAERDIAAAELMRRLQGIRSEIRIAQAELARADDRRARYQTRVAPLLAEAEGLVEDGLASHAVDPVLIANVSARLLDARVTAIEAELSRKKAEIALATATGTLLDALP